MIDNDPPARFDHTHPAFGRDYKAPSRGVTPRRLAAAKRAIQRDRDNNALTPELVRPENCDPITRIQHHDRRMDAFTENMRAFKSRTWRKARRRLRCLPREVQRLVILTWNYQHYPREAAYFAGHVERGYKDLAALRELGRFYAQRSETFRTKLRAILTGQPDP